MAVLKFGAIVVDGRGKIGGHNLSWNRGGNVLQTNSNNGKRSMVRTTRQQTVSRNTIAVKAAWVALTDAKRLAWESAAINYKQTNKVGNTRQMYGYEYFLSVNNYLINAGIPIITIPVPPAVLTLIKTLTLSTPSSGNISVTYSPGISADELLIVSATRGMSVARKPQKTDLKYITIIDNAQLLPFSLTATYTSIFGTVITGTKVWFAFYVLNTLTGQASKQYWVAVQPT